jgi:hypothetical protein
MYRWSACVDASEDMLCRAFQQIRDTHASQPDIASIITLFETWSVEARDALIPFIEEYGKEWRASPAPLPTFYCAIAVRADSR